MLNRAKGIEMIFSLITGYAAVSLLPIIWIILPQAAQTAPVQGHVLNELWNFSLGKLVIPTGLLLVFFGFCLLVWLFLRTKAGAAMQAAGDAVSVAAGRGNDRTRIISAVLSTALGAAGAILTVQNHVSLIYSMAPMNEGIAAATAAIIGGASLRNASIHHVLIGTFLFASVTEFISLGFMESGVIWRTILFNGILLYGLTQMACGNPGAGPESIQSQQTAKY